MLRECNLLVVLLGLIYLSESANGASKIVNVSTKYLFHYGNSLYFIDERTKNWFEARRFCEEMGFNLISFETVEEFNVINRFMNGTGAKSNYWTSGTDFINLGHHAWFPNGKPIPSDLWYPHQPDNMSGYEHCDTFRFKGTDKMNDDICTGQFFYVCELNLST